MCYKVTALADMDGVFAGLEERVIEVLQDEYPWVPIPLPEERNTFYLDEQLGKWGFLVAEIIARPGFFLSLKPIPGAIEGLQLIASIEHVHLAICTSPLKIPTYCVPEKYAWVERYLPTFLDNMIMIRDKTLVDAVIMLEDNPSIKGSRIPTWKLALHDRNHNRWAKDLDRFSWNPDGVGFRWIYEWLKYEFA